MAMLSIGSVVRKSTQNHNLLECVQQSGYQIIRCKADQANYQIMWCKVDRPIMRMMILRTAGSVQSSSRRRFGVGTAHLQSNHEQPCKVRANHGGKRRHKG